MSTNVSKEDNIFLTETDFQKISQLINATQSPIGELLDEELGRASIVADDQIPNDVVKMNSIIDYIDVEDGKLTTVTLVYPHDANIDNNKISILSPIGGALIGLKVGQSISWPLPSGKEKLIKVKSVRS